MDAVPFFAAIFFVAWLVVWFTWQEARSPDQHYGGIFGMPRPKEKRDNDRADRTSRSLARSTASTDSRPLAKDALRTPSQRATRRPGTNGRR